VISATDFLGAASKIANRDYRLSRCTARRHRVLLMSYGLSTLVRRLQQRIAIIRRCHDLDEQREQVVRSFQVLTDCSTEWPRRVVVVAALRRGKSTLIKW